MMILVMLLALAIPAICDYDRSAAHTYAITHCQTLNCSPGQYDSAYPCFVDNDCTNFASQVLQAGGLAQTPQWFMRETQTCPPATTGNYCYEVNGKLWSYSGS